MLKKVLLPIAMMFSLMASSQAMIRTSDGELINLSETVVSRTTKTIVATLLENALFSFSWHPLVTCFNENVVDLSYIRNQADIINDIDVISEKIGNAVALEVIRKKEELKSITIG